MSKESTSGVLLSIALEEKALIKNTHDYRRISRNYSGFLSALPVRLSADRALTPRSQITPPRSTASA